MRRAAQPDLQAVIVPAGAGTPNAGTDIVDRLCAVGVEIVGCGFLPNEVTTICSGIGTETGIPIVRPGKTVTTAVEAVCEVDVKGDGTTEVPIVLANVVPVSKNLITASFPTVSFGSAGAAATSTAFPLGCCGGVVEVIVTTTFTDGDNNVFGDFTRTSVCAVNLGVRAPVVLSASPSSGNCAVPQDILIVGSCFLTPGAVTSVFAVAEDGTVVQATVFTILKNDTIDALFNFGSANAGKVFRIFVTGPGGTSRNLSALVAGQTCNILGNEQGIQVTFTCNSGGNPGDNGNPPDIAKLDECRLNRTSSGGFVLTVLGSNIKQGATATVGGVEPRKIKFKSPISGTQAFGKLVLKGRVCQGLPGAIIVTNPGPNGGPSQPLSCAKTCPSN